MQKYSTDVESVFVELSKAIGGVRGWGLFAGAANVFYGVEHPVNDVDIFYDLNAENALLNALESFDPCKPFLYETGKAQWKKFEFKLNGFEIEFCADYHWNFAGKMRFFFDEEMEKRIHTVEIGGRDFRLLSPEDNFVFKAILQRGLELNKTDVADAKGLLENNALDLVYVRERAMKGNAEQRVMGLVEKLRLG